MGDGSAVRGNRFVANHVARCDVSPVVQMPDLGSANLQDQHVVLVVVRDEALRLRWREIGVELGREVQLDLDGVQQRGQSADVSMNTFQNDRVAVGEVSADGFDVETVGTPVGVCLLFVVLPDQAHQRQIRPKETQQLVN